MGNKYLVDDSDAELIGVNSPTDPKTIKKTVSSVGPDQETPVYELTYWNGKIKNDIHGNVYPDVIRTYATLGNTGVRWSEVDETDLDYTDLLKHMQAQGFLRVDSLIGLMPMKADKDRNVYVEWSNQLCDESKMRELMEMGARINNTNLRPSESLYRAVGNARDAIRLSRAEAAVVKAEEGYKRWRDLLESIKPVDSDDSVENDVFETKKEKRKPRKQAAFPE